MSDSRKTQKGSGGKKKQPTEPGVLENDLKANVTIINSLNVPEFLKSNPDLIKKLKSTLLGREFVSTDGLNTKILTFDTQPNKFVEGKQLTIIHHDSKKQSWLMANVEKWQLHIESLHVKWVCSIFSEKDFSKIYMFTESEESGFLISEISKFWDESPSDIQITPHVLEFLKHNEKFSDLKVEKSAQEGIWIRSLEKPRLAKLKEEVGKVSSQCYLLDKIQYDLLSTRKGEILSPIEENLQVKGEAFAADIPLVIEMNPLTSVSCIVEDQSGNYPVDNLIIWNTQEPSQDFTQISDRHYYKISNLFPWDQPLNQVVYAELLPTFKEDQMKAVLEDCLKNIYVNPLPVTVLGIRPCFQSKLNWKKFFSCLESTLNYLQEEQMNIPRHYIMVIVENGAILAQIKRIFGNENSFTEVGQRKLNVTVIEGDLTEQKVDIIVNSTNCMLDLNVGSTSIALLKKAGQELSRECKRSYPKGIDFLTCAMTKGYNLPCQYVLHGVLPNAYKKNALSTLVVNLLEMAANCKASSIAFPVLGTGQLKYPPDEVTKEMNEGFMMFSQKFPTHTITEVRIVVFPGQPTIKRNMSKIMTAASVDLPPGASFNSEEKSLINYQQKLLLWILFVNYSGEPLNMKSVFSYFQKEIEKVPFEIVSEDLENLIFFTGIFSLIPDIITQYPEKKPGKIQLLVLRKHHKQLNDSLKHITSKLTHESLKANVKFNDQQLKILSQKFNQRYPMVRLQVTDNGQTFHFHSLDSAMNQEAKYLFESFLGLRENILSMTDKKTNKSGVKDVPPNIPIQPERVDLVKVYQGDILNLGGLVEAIVNVWIPEVPSPIIKAAGEVVAKEMKDELDYGEFDSARLSDGKVVITSAGNLKQYKKIIHAVEPICDIEKPDDSWMKIAEIVYYSLKKASQYGLRSLALPAICYKIPPEIYINGYVKGVEEFYKRKSQQCQLQEIYFVDLNPNTCKAIRDVFPGKNIQQPNVKSPSFPFQRKVEDMEVDTVGYTCFACNRVVNQPMIEKKCKHIFCSHCIVKPCTVCLIQRDIISHPGGNMSIEEVSDQRKTNYVMHYRIPLSFHENQRIEGIMISAYLPKTEDGETILRMLQMAFEQYLTFTVKGNMVTLSDIPLITNRRYCWNPEYLDKIKAWLAKKGITPENIVKGELRTPIIIK